MAAMDLSASVSANTDFNRTFLAIKNIFAKYESQCVVLHDEPGKYYLATHRVRPKDGHRVWLGGVEIKKNYVSAHVFAVYVYPELLETVPAALKKRMQGKACFNFKKPDDALFAELGVLLEAGVRRLTSPVPIALS